MGDDEDRDFAGNIIFVRSDDTDFGDFISKHADAIYSTNYDRLISIHAHVVAGDPAKSAGRKVIATAFESAPTSEEHHLAAVLGEEDADAVLGDLAELAKRDAATMSSKEAAKRRRARARDVHASLPKSAWRRVLRGFLYSMEMQFYWYGAVALYLLYAIADVIHHSR